MTTTLKTTKPVASRLLSSTRALAASALIVGAPLALSGCGYNEFQTLDEQVNASWSEVLSQYQRRADLIPNIVNTVKGEANFEQETLTRVVEARAKATSIQVTPELAKDPEALKRFQAAQGELSSALSRLLKADADCAERLARLEGAVIEVQLKDSPRRAYALPGGHGVSLRRHHEGDVAVRVSGRVADFIAYARASRRGDSLGAGRIEISGDLAVAQQVQALLSDLSIDWEEVLAGAIGDVPAHALGRIVRTLGAWGESTLRRFERDAADYLMHETRLVVQRREVDELGRSVFALADDAERLAVRVQRLRARRQK